MPIEEGTRIDKWLWAVRILKSRSLATDLCKKGKVFIDGIPVKPSRIVRVGDVITIKKPPVDYTYRITGLISKRVSATIAAEHIEHLTPQEELDKLQNMHESAFFIRDRGAGRPTKKDRRDLDKFQI